MMLEAENFRVDMPVSKLDRIDQIAEGTVRQQHEERFDCVNLR